MPLTPEDVANKQFTSTRLKPGYDETEVDEFLDEVEAELTRLYRENDELRSKLAAAGSGAPAPAAAQAAAPAAPAAPAEPDPAVAARTRSSRRRARRGQRQLAEASQPRRPPSSRPPHRLLRRRQPSGSRPRPRPASWRWPSAPPTSTSPRRAPRPTGSSARPAPAPSSSSARAEDKHRQIIGSLETERSALERKVEKLRSFEREYRSRLKSYLEGQLRELDGRGSEAPAGQAAARRAASRAVRPAGPAAPAGPAPAPGRTGRAARSPRCAGRATQSPSGPPQQPQGFSAATASTATDASTEQHDAGESLEGLAGVVVPWGQCRPVRSAAGGGQPAERVAGRRGRQRDPVAVAARPPSASTRDMTVSVLTPASTPAWVTITR